MIFKGVKSNTLTPIEGLTPFFVFMHYPKIMAFKNKAER